MSADQDGPVSEGDHLDEIMRAAEQAVDEVRSGKSDDGDDPMVEVVDEVAL
jgi:molecular chaperone GrpE